MSKLESNIRKTEERISKRIDRCYAQLRIVAKHVVLVAEKNKSLKEDIQKLRNYRIHNRSESKINSDSNGVQKQQNSFEAQCLCFITGKICNKCSQEDC